MLDLDVQSYFDSIDWELMLKAVRHHTDCPWVLLYIERWLKAPVQLEDGSIVARHAGTPQGGVVSPILSNLFLHYVFDAWMERTRRNNGILPDNVGLSGKALRNGLIMVGGLAGFAALQGYLQYAPMNTAEPGTYTVALTAIPTVLSLDEAESLLQNLATSSGETSSSSRRVPDRRTSTAG